MKPLSPGLAQGCFDLLDIVVRRTPRFAALLSEFSKLRGMPVDQVVETAQTLGWLKQSDDGMAVVTPTGMRVLHVESYEARLRLALLDYIEALKPAWVQSAVFGRARVLNFAGKSIAQVFTEAGLADGLDDDVVEFWDTMAAMARGQRSANAMKTGRAGERLTLAYEQERTGRTPKWVAVDSNSDGYDVLSVVGPDDPRFMSIEVKSTTVGLAGSLHITANEWERATFQEEHRFHLWEIRPTSVRLAVLTPTDVAPHVPANQGEGAWESVEVPFGVFAERFCSVPATPA